MITQVLGWLAGWAGGFGLVLFAWGLWCIGCELHAAIVAWRREREVLIQVAELHRDRMKRVALRDPIKESDLANTDHQSEVNEMKQ